MCGILVACSSGSHHPSPPTDDMDLLNSLMAKFDTAEEAIASCVREHDLQYQPRTIALTFADPDQGLRTWTEERRARGYGISMVRDFNVVIEISDTPATDSDRQAFQALVLAPGAPCAAPDPRDVVVAGLEADQERSAPNLLAGFETEWAACMSAKGFSFASPTEAFGTLDVEFEQAVGTEEAAEVFRERELLVAAADADCLSINLEVE